MTSWSSLRRPDRYWLSISKQDVRRLATQALQDTIANLPPDVIVVLVRLAMDSYRDLRVAALRTLSELELRANADVRSVCRAGLQHEHPHIREAAAEALGRVGYADEDVVTALLDTLEDSVDHVQLAASNALLSIGQGTAHELIINRVRRRLDQHPQLTGALNTLWELVVGE